MARTSNTTNTHDYYLESGIVKLPAYKAGLLNKNSETAFLRSPLGFTVSPLVKGGHEKRASLFPPSTRGDARRAGGISKKTHTHSSPSTGRGILRIFHKSVRIFVQSTFPRVVWLGKKTPAIETFIDQFVCRKFPPVVIGIESSFSITE